MKRVWVALLLGSMLITFVLPLFVDYGEGDHHAATARASNILIRYSFLLKNTSNAVVKEVRFRAFAPIRSTPFQEVESIRSNVGFAIDDGASGNRSLDFQLDAIPPFGQRVINVTAELKIWRYQRPGLTFGNGISGRLMPMDNPTLRAVLAEIENNHPGAEGAQWADAAQAWLHEHITQTSYHAENRGAMYALSSLQGDCTEMMSAFIALAQTKQLPVLGAVGFPISSDSVRLRSEDLHNWAYLKDGGNWYAADSFNHKSLYTPGRYVAFAVLESRKDLLGKRRFSVSDSRIKAVMR